MSTQSLLPDNRTLIETALEQTLNQFLQDIPAPLPGFLNAEVVPVESLPYLAAAKSVPHWSLHKTEQEKRQATADQWIIQRQSGMRSALLGVLKTLGYEGEIVYGNSPYQIEVQAWRSNSPVVPDDVNRLVVALDEVKAERDEAVVSLVLGFETGWRCSGAISAPLQLFDQSVEAALVSAPALVGGFSMAGGCRAVAIDDRALEGRGVSVEPLAPVALAGGTRWVVINDMELGA
ncbi:phage tail protein I [Marinobacterium jannaschii]|uniref:phage tail protein I n=1 Tax=Marinobacterium jannaschii TaxID=64970 RepID=UPI000480AB78|nr:phage tail protein I [Marinobacterium jannaschii]